ncbi:membrane dipeptidase [Bacteroidales bacterium OttesenSCG-928-M06]|nr:membrane dipeptidase [Bacteroidales bacterium OttesenSCG-928-M06]
MLIGLSVNHKEGLSCIANAYVKAVIKAGGFPVLIPLTNSSQVLDEILSNIDGLILSGGGDIHSSFFNEELHPTVTSYDLERDEYDIYLTRKAIERNIPLLGICRGHQVINVALGGGIIQDIPSQVPQSTINHSQSEPREIGTHKINILSDSLLYTIMQVSEMEVNTFHHQACRNLAPGLKESAFSEDKLNEAVESIEGKNILGVQWHPENMALTETDSMRLLFNHIVGEARLYHLAKEIHQRNFIIDSHCDTPMYFGYGVNIGNNNGIIRVKPSDLGATSENNWVDYQIQVDIPKMREGLIDATFMVAYIKQDLLDSQSSQKAVEKTESILKEIIRQTEENKNTVGIARTPNDLKCLKREGRKAIFLGIENGYGIGKDITNLQKFADLGISYITLSHNGDNDICDSAMQSSSTHNGLSEYGKEVVKEMNRLGLMIDISHTSEKTSFDVLKISKLPIIASHSSAKALRNHPRNISDSLIKAIADKGGVIQVCLYTYFLRKDDEAQVKDAVDHIDYIIKKAGIDHVGIGSDFDGGGSLTDVKTVSGMPKITMELIRRGYSEEEIAKIWGGNLMRVMNIIQNNKQ